MNAESRQHRPSDEAQEIPLQGGNLTPVVRVGDTVRRAPGPWTTTVHRLLRHLEDVGFTQAPRALGFDESGREILSFIDGVAGFVDASRIEPTNLWSDEVLIKAARLLRDYHEATIGFEARDDDHWQLSHPDPVRHEVICHNDPAWYNCVFEHGQPQAWIDFDTAGPGPRIWDIAYASWRFVPIGPGSTPLAEQGRRLRLFCDSYGLAHREELLPELGNRIRAARDMVLNGAAAGHAGYRAIIAEGGHIEGMGDDLAFVIAHAFELRDWLTRDVT